MPKANPSTTFGPLYAIAATRPNAGPARPTRPATPPDDAEPPVRDALDATDTKPALVPVRPGRSRDVGTAWLVLMGLLVLASIPLTIELMRPAMFDRAEDRAVTTSVETWQRNIAFKDPEHALDPWTPVYLGQTRANEPPAATWLHVLALRRAVPAPDEDAAITPIQQARTWGRIIAVGMTLLLIGSVYWAGHSVGGLMTAALSGFVAMSMPVLIFFGRIGTGDVHAAAWVALAIAAALWAMRPMRRNPSLIRQFTGWLLCGLGIGMATLTHGPLAIPPVILPLAVMSMICPRRLGHTLGVIAAIAGAVLVVTPWSIHVHEAMPDGWRYWIQTLKPDGMVGDWATYTRSIGWRASAIIAITGVWALWLIPAIVQPFSTSTRDARRSLMIGWAWFVTTTALMLLAPGPASVRPLLLIFAPTALLIGQVMKQFHDLSAEGRHARMWRVGRLLTIVFTAALSLALPALAAFEADLPRGVTQWAGIDAALFAPMHPGFYLGAGLALLLIAIMAARFALANHPGRAVVSWAVWVLVLASLLAFPLSRGDLLLTPAQQPQVAGR